MALSILTSSESTSMCSTWLTESRRRFVSAAWSPASVKDCMGLTLKNQSNNQRGFSLIEFMISGLLTLVVLAATFTLLNNLFVANTSIQQTLGAQQNLRVGMNALSRDI